MLIALLSVTCAYSARAQGVTCGPAGPYVNAHIASVRDIVSGTSAGAAKLRASFSLPPVAASSVQLVTNDSVCTVAANALRQTVGRTDLPLAQTWVIQVGPTRYWVFDPRFKTAIDFIHAVYDESWTNLSLITG